MWCARRRQGLARQRARAFACGRGVWRVSPPALLVPWSPPTRVPVGWVNGWTGERADGRTADACPCARAQQLHGVHAGREDGRTGGCPRSRTILRQWRVWRANQQQATTPLLPRGGRLLPWPWPARARNTAAAAANNAASSSSDRCEGQPWFWCWVLCLDYSWPLLTTLRVRVVIFRRQIKPRRDTTVVSKISKLRWRDL